ncbi:hypothetical protein WJX84_006173 [Apatococcus fuscideae]|uniref:Helicase Sen1 N-terminal domain-containing protein n=1 Tax=Apatococcus fuscideae TaxID=2026836 RepID=A0AAW1TEV5_9CHLO
MSGEQELLERLEAAKASGSFDQGWYSDAARHLQHLDHWWCRHTRLTLGLSTVFSYGTANPAVQHIWDKMALQLSACSDCTSHFHSSQEFYHETVDPETAGPLLTTLASLNMARVASALASAFSQDGAKISGKVVTALYEVLYHPSLLHDEEIMLTLGRAMVHLSTHYEMDITESHERYPGLYCLLTHPEVAVRSLASSAVRSIGAFQAAADVEPLLPILHHWQMGLRGRLDARELKIPEGRMPFQPSSSAIWTAISALFGSQGSHLMQPSAMTAVLNRFPDLLDMAVQEASTLGLSARQAISSLRGVLTCIGNQIWAYMSHDPCSIIQGCSHVAAQATDMRVCSPAIQAMAQVVIELQKAGSGMYERPRRLCLEFLTVKLPRSPQAMRQPQVILLAANSAFRVVAIGIEGGIPAALDGDVYLTALAREVHGSSASAQDLCSKIILSDALALASICDHSLRDLAPNDERVAELGEIVPRHASGWTCLPRVWQAAASGSDPQAALACLQALLKLASAVPPASRHQTNSKAAQRTQEPGRGFLIDPVHAEKGSDSSKRIFRTIHQFMSQHLR